MHAAFCNKPRINAARALPRVVFHPPLLNEAFSPGATREQLAGAYREHVSPGGSFSPSFYLCFNRVDGVSGNFGTELASEAVEFSSRFLLGLPEDFLFFNRVALRNFQRAGSPPRQLGN